MLNSGTFELFNTDLSSASTLGKGEFPHELQKNNKTTNNKRLIIIKKKTTQDKFKLGRHRKARNMLKQNKVGEREKKTFQSERDSKEEVKNMPSPDLVIPRGSLCLVALVCQEHLNGLTNKSNEAGTEEPTEEGSVVIVE